MPVIKTAFFILISLLVVTMPYESPGQMKWFLLACISALFTAWHIIRPRLGLPAAALFAYCVINGAWFWIWRDNRYIGLCLSDETGRCAIDPATGLPMLDHHTQQAIRFYVADGVGKILLVIPPLLYLLKKGFSYGFFGWAASSAFCFVNTLMVFYTLIKTRGCEAINSCGGSLSNPSMNASMIAVTLPFLISSTAGWFRWFSLSLAVGAIYFSKSSVALGLLCVLGGMYAFLHCRKLLLLSPLPLLAGYLALGQRELFSSGDRFPIWEFMMSAWVKNPLHYAFGTGYGTFGVFSANLQTIHQFRTKNWWVWMHNDWLEILFTLGATGLILALLTYLSSLYRLVKNRSQTEAMALILFGLTMCVNYPLHHPISALFGAWLVFFGLYREEKFSNESLASRTKIVNIS